MIWDRITRPNRRDQRRRKDPLTIGVWVAVNLGWTGITAVGATIVGSLVLGAVGLGLSLLAGALFSPGQRSPTPSERQATLRQSIGARTRYYGRVMVGGTVGFFENSNGYLYQMATLNWGEISSVAGRYLADKFVTVDGSGYVQQDDFISEGSSAVQMLYKYGQPDQTAHAQLLSAFPSAIDANFRMRNMANYLAIFHEVKREDIARVFPQLNPSVRHLIDASLCERVRQEDIAYSDNPSDVIYDYLVGVDGAGYPWGAGYLKSQVNLASFQAFADTSDDAIPIKAGGTMPRYRLWGGFGMSEETRAVLPRFAAACDADIYMDTEGRIAIRGGKWEAPALTLDAELGHIITGDFRHGRQALAAFNELTISYTEPTLDYQETECEPWLDAANIALRGQVLPGRLDLRDVPHHAQARRLGKIHTHKQNPEWTGSVITNFHGINAIGENMVRIKFPLLGIDEDFMIISLRVLDNLSGVELSVSSLSESAYDWDAELEEGSPPNTAPDTSSPVSLDPPADFNVSAAQRDLGGGGTGTFLVATWTEPARTALEQETEYASVPGGTWVAMSPSDGVGLAESGLVTDGLDYVARIRTRSPGGFYGDWSAEFPVTATPDLDPPVAVTDIVGSGLAGSASLTWEMSADLHSIGVRIYRNTIADEGTATLIATIYGSPSTAGGYLDAIVAGTYYYYIASWSGSFVEGTKEPTGAVVVT